MPERLASPVKRARGTARQDRSPRPAGGERLTAVVPPPEHLTERAKGEWQRLMPDLIALGTAAACDLRGFELLCETLALESDLREQISRDGLTIDGAAGKKANPALRALDTARSGAHRLLSDFGLLPKGRMGVDAARPPDKENPFAELIEAGRRSRGRRHG